jgi:poly(hydroxyalkanoate) depolymerase family esterase
MKSNDKKRAAVHEAAPLRQSGRIGGFIPELLAGLGFSWPVGEATSGIHENKIDAPGCGEFIAGSYSNHVGTRNYKLYIPGGYHGQSMPLLVMLHGCTQSPDDFAAGTRMNAIAEERQCLVVYPEQAESANGSKCWNWFKSLDQQRDQGEPSIIAGITREVIKTWHVDPRQVFIAGLSSGGAMAVIMVATYPDLYAAAGVHSGLPYASARDLPSAMVAMKEGMGAGGAIHSTSSTSARSIPIIVFHGDRDTTVHPRNGDQIIAQWMSNAAADRPVPKGRTSPHTTIGQGKIRNGHAYTHIVHRNGSGHAIAEQWLVHGAGHAWSGGSNRGSFTDSKGPDAGKEMMRFFSAHAQFDD